MFNDRIQISPEFSVFFQHFDEIGYVLSLKVVSIIYTAG